MDKKRANPRWIKLIVMILTISAMIHTGYSFYNLSGHNSQGGISGNSISDDSQKTISGISINEKIILGAEWLLVASVFLISILGGRMELKTIDEVIVTPKKTKSNISKTDLDSMYEILKEKKALRIKTLAKYFKVDERTIAEWARVLEEANLVTVHYPIIGDPQIILNEGVNNEEPPKA